jgi:hypothetical protein
MPHARADESEAASDAVLQRLRIPFVRRVILEREGREEEAFLLDIGLDGAFVERAEPLQANELIAIRFPWPGSEVPFRARCRVAWWHDKSAPLVSKSLSSGAGLQFVEMSEPDRERLHGLLIEYSRQDPGVRRFLRHWPEQERSDDPTAG